MIYICIVINYIFLYISSHVANAYLLASFNEYLNPEIKTFLKGSSQWRDKSKQGKCNEHVCQ